MQTLRVFTLIFVTLLSATSVVAAETVFKLTTNEPMQPVYDRMYKNLEDERFWVIFEPNIGKNLSGFAGKWGDAYNRNQLTSIRSLVFCNPWYANEVSNADPDMLALCPLHLSLYEKDGSTTAVFMLPTHIAKNSPANKVLREVENTIIRVIRKTMSQ